MATDKAPAYQMYARDWLGSRSVRLMTDFQRGWYIQLLNEAWDSDPQGMLPNDAEMLMGLAGVTEARRSEPGFNRCWAAVMARFIVSGDWIYNEKQFTQVAENVEYRRQQSIKGTASAAKRAARKAEMELLLQKANSGSTAVEPRLNRGSTEGSTEGQPEVNPPTPTPSPPASAEENPPTPRKRGKRPQADAGEGPDPFGWSDFAAVYPGFRLKPDKAAKAWFRRNVTDTAEGRVVLAQILGNVGQWLQSEQWIQGKVPNCSRYLDEGIWQGVPGPPPYRSGQAGQEDIFKGLESWERS